MSFEVTPGRGQIGEKNHGVKRLNFRYGRSVSGVDPSKDLSASPSNDKFQITINGDGPHTVTLKNLVSLKDPNTIAQQIEQRVRGVKATDQDKDLAFQQFVCKYDGKADVYILVSGLEGPGSAVVVTDASVGNVASLLKLGTANTGTEDQFYPRQARYSEYVTLAEVPVPVVIEGIDEINIDGAQLDVNLSHLDDIPNAGDVHDSLRIGGPSGNEAEVNSDNELLVEVSAADTPVIANIEMPLANTEYSYALPNGTKQFAMKLRGTGKLQFAFEAGQSNINYIFLAAGKSYSTKDVKIGSGLTLYFQSPKNNQVLEIISWE